MKSVTIYRDSHGFGFSLSTQRPYLLDSVQSNGPAASVGLKSNDQLISINNQSINYWSHDEVAALLRTSGDCLTLEVERPQVPTFVWKGQEVGTSRTKTENGRTTSEMGLKSRRSSRYADVWRSMCQISDSPDRKSEKVDENALENALENARNKTLLLFRYVIVYIGAVPVINPSRSKRTIIKSAIKSLRKQQAKALTVMLQLYDHQLVVTNSRGIVTHRFSNDRIFFAHSCEENKQYFGLAMSVQSGNVACHIFAADPQLHLHSFHYQYAIKFGFRCSKDTNSLFCCEFPHNSAVVINRMTSLIGQQLKNGTQSNGSDSGIGEVHYLQKNKGTVTDHPNTRMISTTFQVHSQSSPSKMAASMSDFLSNEDSDPFSSSRSEFTCASPYSFQHPPTVDHEFSHSTVKMFHPAAELTNVERILQNPEARKPFQTFLEHQFCAENLNFFIVVEEYRRVQDIQQRVKLARSIYDRHFTPNSAEPVNIDNNTAKIIKEAIVQGHYSSELYDTAQYQIFHLLKYDCWPRFLQWQTKFLVQNKQFQIDEQQRQSGTSTIPSTESTISELSVSSSPLQPTDKSETKRRSLLWQGLKPRFSRRKKECPPPPPTISAFPTSPSHSLVVKTTPQARSPTVSSSLPTVVYSGTSFVGSRRRQVFSNAGKQLSVPTGVSGGDSHQFGASCLYSQSSTVVPAFLPSTSATRPDVVPESEPTTQNQPSDSAERLCTVCTEDGRTKAVKLTDPQESVAKWTRCQAEQRGLCPVASDAIDAKTGVLIDPARQALDALSNRSVRLTNAILLRLELFLVGDSKLVAVKTRPGMTTAATLRPVLCRYGMDLAQVVVSVAGTNEVLPQSTVIDRVDRRQLCVMTTIEFQGDFYQGQDPMSSFPEWLSSPPQISQARNWPSTPLMVDHWSKCTFLSVGNDVRIAELDHDDARHSKHGAVRSFSSHTKTDPFGGMLKFVRKASSHSNRSDSHSEQQRRKSIGTLHKYVSSAFRSTESAPDPITKEELHVRLQQDRHLDDLLGRAQASRLDDQRGTTPGCCELPDFLKTYGDDHVNVVRVDNRWERERKKDSSPAFLYVSSVCSEESQRDTVPHDAWHTDYV